MGILRNITLLCVVALVSCGWVGGFGDSARTPIPPSEWGGGETESPPPVAPGFDSQGPDYPGGGLTEPRLGVSLFANMLANGEVEWNATWTSGTSPYTIAWDFGGGAMNFSEQAAASPASVSVAMNGLGPYFVQVTVTDALGVPGLGIWLYTMDPENVEGVLVDDRIYAYYEKGQASAGEEILVTVTTGKLAHPFQFMLGVGLVLDEDAQYVRNSFNVGSPGGERDFPDGIWAEVDPFTFALGPDVLIIPGPNPEDSIGTKKRYDFNISPLNPILGPGDDIIGGQGDLFNLRFKYSVPGLKTLAFQRSNGVNRTYYMGAWDNAWDNSDRFWDDVSNWHPNLQTSIVVE